MLDVVLQDFCSVVGTGDPLHTRVWMRNVFNEPKGGALGECTDIDAPLVSRASPCRKVVFLPGEFCFSGENTVDLEDGSSLKMKDLSLGDRVKTGDGTFESVYTFAHYHHDIEAEFVQIFAKSMSNNPLELSADHMVFLHGKDAPAPAGSLVVGDTLLLGDGQSAEIVKLKQVTRHGAYAPFTASGSIVVNNVVASNYISFESGPYMTIGGMQYVSYHWMSHLTQAPRRLYCSMVSNCEKESYTEQGVAVWAVAPLHAGQWWMGLNNSIVKGILIGITLAVLLIVASMEAVVNNSWMLTAAVGSVGLLCHRSAKQQQGKTVA
jgi:desert hedgehog protein